MGVTAIRPSDVILAVGPYLSGLKNGALVRKYASSSRGGEEVKETHTRASTGYYVDRDLKYRLGAVDVLRPNWLDRDADGVADTLAVLLEEQDTNLCDRSSDINAWTSSGTIVVTNDSLVIGDVGLALLDDTDGAAQSFKHKTIAFTGDAVKGITVHVAKGSNTTSFFKLRDNTAAVDRLGVTLTWNADGTLSTAVAGTGTVLATRRLASLVYEILCQTTSVTAANTNRIELTPTTGGAAVLGSAYYGGVGAFNSPQPSSVIKTTVGTVARNRDILSFPLYVAPNKNLCIYHRHIERDTPNWPGSMRLWQIGSAANTAPRLIGQKPSAGVGTYNLQHDNNVTNVNSTVSGLGPALNDIIETRATYTAATGIVQMGAAKTLGSESLAAASGALAPGAAWSGPLLHINGVNNTGVGRQGWIATIVATWSGSAPSMDDFRALLT